MLWESPIYRFRIPKNHEDGECSELKEVVIDVTGSAPTFKEPSDNLKFILKEIFQSSSYGTLDNVLEFGAAKLKNIPFILEQGKTVCAVEFKELSDNDFAKENIKKCRKYGDKFQNLIFPNPFINDQKKFDLVLLANVIPVMPVFAERLFVLQLLYEKVNDKKYVLWIAQKEGSYKSIREKGENVCGDGTWMGSNRYHKTFYKYHNVEELDEMMALSGFELVKKFCGGDDARLYCKIPYNLFKDLITPDIILKYIPVDSTIKDPDSASLKIIEDISKYKMVIPNPQELSIESLYIEKIKNIPIGKDAEMYHRIVSYAISRIFRGSLRNIDIKVDMDGGIKIIDTVFTNCAEKGFFKNLQNKIDCNYPMIEVKNTKDDPGNPEFDQLNGRLNKNQGHFGILICRKVDGETAVYKRCQTYLPDRYILFLTDEEIIELLEHSRDENQDVISDFMDKKLRKLLFRSN